MRQERARYLEKRGKDFGRSLIARKTAITLLTRHRLELRNADRLTKIIQAFVVGSRYTRRRSSGAAGTHKSGHKHLSSLQRHIEAIHGYLSQQAISSRGRQQLSGRAKKASGLLGEDLYCVLALAEHGIDGVALLDDLKQPKRLRLDSLKNISSAINIELRRKSSAGRQGNDSLKRLIISLSIIFREQDRNLTAYKAAASGEPKGGFYRFVEDVLASIEHKPVSKIALLKSVKRALPKRDRRNDGNHSQDRNRSKGIDRRGWGFAD